MYRRSSSGFEQSGGRFPHVGRIPFVGAYLSVEEQAQMRKIFETALKEVFEDVQVSIMPNEELKTPIPETPINGKVHWWSLPGPRTQIESHLMVARVGGKKDPTRASGTPAANLARIICSIEDQMLVMQKNNAFSRDFAREHLDR